VCTLALEQRWRRRVPHSDHTANVSECARAAAPGNEQQRRHQPLWVPLPAQRSPRSCSLPSKLRIKACKMQNTNTACHWLAIPEKRGALRQRPKCDHPSRHDRADPCLRLMLTLYKAQFNQLSNLRISKPHQTRTLHSWRFLFLCTSRVSSSVTAAPKCRHGAVTRIK